MQREHELFPEQLTRLANKAWEARERSRILGNTAVGCAVLADDGRVFGGCNVEHRFRSHDIHAETNALSTMVAGGAEVARAVFIAAERDHFTPCGACMDWIFELGGADCFVLVQAAPDGDVKSFRASELMPQYPY
jgi:cytidine deaminase